MRAEVAKVVLYVDGSSENWEMDLLNRVISHTFTDMAAACRVHGWDLKDAHPNGVMNCALNTYGTVTNFAIEMGFRVQDVSPANSAKPAPVRYENNVIAFPLRA